MSRGTGSVQRFIRTLIWIVVFGLLCIVLTPSSLRYINALGVMDLGPILGRGLLLLAGYCVAIWIASTAAGMFHILPEWQRLVLLKLGKFAGVKGPGVFVIPPFLYSVADIVSTRITTKEVTAAETLTKDNVPVTVKAAIEYEVEDPHRAIIRVEDYLLTVTWVAEEALKNTIGCSELKELLGDRDKIAEALKREIDKMVEEYGVNVRAVRITDIATPPGLVEELAVIARAERGARAKNIQAEAEVQVARKLAEAAEILQKSPAALQVRQIQALLEMSKEEGTMIIVYPAEGLLGQQIAAATAGAKTK